MDLPHNRFLDAIRSRTPQIGFWCAMASPIATEIAGGAGFDWIVIDMEHTTNDVASVLAQLHALSACEGISPLVRVPSADPVLMKRLLDVGVVNFLVPFVETVEQARTMVAATRYPPFGNRGAYLGSRGGRFGRVQGYFQRAHTEICVIAQLETEKGLECLEEIAAVEGLGAIFIGPNDLCADMGQIGNLHYPGLKAAVFGAAGRLARMNVPAGCTTFGDTGFAECVEAGFSFVSVGTDVGAMARSTESLAAIKSGT